MDAEGGSQPKDLAPPLTATLLPEREPGSGLPAADPAPNPPSSATGRAPAEAGAATTASQPPPESECPP